MPGEREEKSMEWVWYSWAKAYSISFTQVSDINNSGLKTNKFNQSEEQLEF